MSASEFTHELLMMIRNQFYPDNAKGFGVDQNFLKQAVTYPAHWLHTRGARVSLDRQKVILLAIIQEIKRHGNVGRIRRFAIYLLHVVQEHMKHHGEDYLDESKRIQANLDAVLHRLKPASGKIVDPGDSVAVLAEIHKALKTQSRRPKAVKSTQLDLL